ncbi:MAG TPA: YidC/Oxa1 family membrane protein insertase [Ktedonobacteraceae bacterium]|nr:YidC/Oxa1 family membrane protein insertase [Ktedonobacteraceae bacterium]
MSQIGYFFNIIFTFPIFNLLMLLHYVIGDFALSIIVLTVIMRMALFPLTLKQLKSTKAMQQIQPLIADVKKQYPKDQRAQLEATQAIYKEYGINPAAGCLPLLVQLPVLYGLFYALNTVLRGGTIATINNTIYPFLPKLPLTTNITALTDFHWFAFLNPAWHMPLSASDPTHILPVLAGLATFVQLRMSQPRNVSTSNNAMANQMKIMQYIMPFFTFFIALNFPAGLALYWTTSSLFSMVQQYFVTGWGSLLERPKFFDSLGLGGTSKASSSNGKSNNGDSRKETRLLSETADSNAAAVEGVGGRNGSNGAYNGNSSRRRPPRPGSASARRRGNTPKRNPSRS